MKENLDLGKGELFIRSLKRRLPEDERGKLGRELTVEEAYNVIKAMKANKVPGIDGLTKEFYVAFWDMVGIHLLGVFKEIMEGEEMSDSMKTGVVSILFKKGNPNHLDNYRPLTMLCVDYKILSKILANRL
uniref:Reverse transcriptase domain-containing protein n=1 Tax=Haplochromis burtoni TaxID=8153 RepID=A0A3Q3BHJ2_HAPBU